LHKGDLPSAEGQLDAVIVDAERAGESDALARARHNRGLVAYERGQFEKAAAYFYSAANRYPDAKQVQRALADVAMALSDLGQLDFARRTYAAARNASESPTEIRTLAGLNLMRIAVLSGNQKTFDSLRQVLANEEMPGRFRAHYHLISGQGFRRFGQAGFARASFESAILVAQAHKVNRLVIEAESMLAAEPDVRPVPKKDVRASPDLADLLEDIAQGRGVFAGTV
jgi:tetratricopeptide (TPR) repeat protein